MQRLLRDILSDDIANIRLDGEKEFQRTLDMVNVLQPELAPRVRLYNGSQAILEEFGVEEPGLEAVIAACYRALDLITFLTTGEDETRAWEVPHGATAPEAAGVIHTDLQRGFIRAEVIGYDELVVAGSMDQAKAAGKVRVEGKDYLVQEGDILHVRFAV